ncbi:LysM peptidoglycan-binding domain-containing protein [Isosphaeraceae bacterium EP7]
MNDHESQAPLDSFGSGLGTPIDSDLAQSHDVAVSSADRLPDADLPEVDAPPSRGRLSLGRLTLPGRWETRVGIASLLSFLVLVTVLVINRKKGDVPTHPRGAPTVKKKSDGSPIEVAALDKVNRQPSNDPPPIMSLAVEGTANLEEAPTPPPTPVASNETAPTDSAKAEAVDAGLPTLPPDDEKDPVAATPAVAPPVAANSPTEPGMNPPEPPAPPVPVPAPTDPLAGALPVASEAPPVPVLPPVAEANPLPAEPEPAAVTALPTPEQAGQPAPPAPAEVPPAPSQQVTSTLPEVETPAAAPALATTTPPPAAAPEVKASPQPEAIAPKPSADVPVFTLTPASTEPVALPARASIEPKGPWVTLPNAKNRLIGAAGGGVIIAGSATSLAESSDDLKKERVQPIHHLVRGGDSFDSISQNYYGSGRFSRALWSANRSKVPRPGELTEGQTILIPPPEQLDRSLIVPAGKPLAQAGGAARPVTKTKRVASATQATDEAIALPIAPPRPRSAAVLQGDRDPIDPQYQEEYPRYRVRAYDTLRSIAKKKLGDSHRAAEIIDLNRDLLGDDVRVVAGQVIKLPEDARDR